MPYNGELVMEEPTLRSGIGGKIVGGGDGSILYRDRLEVTSMTADPQYDYYTDPRDPRVEVNGNKVYILWNDHRFFHT